MASTRRQLAAAYAAAFVGIAFLMGIAFWLGTIDDNYAQHTRVEELRRYNVLVARADTIMGLLQSYVATGHADDVTSIVPAGADSVEEIAPNLRSQLSDRQAYVDQGLPLYIAVFSPDRRAIFASADLSELQNTVYQPIRGRFGTDSVALVIYAAMNTLSQLAPDMGNVTMQAFGKRMMLLAVRPPPGITRVSRVVVGTEIPLRSHVLGQLGATFVLFATLLVLVSLWAIYAITRGSSRPVEHIINEVEAITDGRSLHKRLAIDHSNAELARLAATLNAMMERLEVSFTALRTFTADASHELNTPLAVLRADVERAMNPAAGADEQMVALEEALREIRRMSDLVDSLLTLARADEGRLDMLRERVDISALTQDVYETALLLGEDSGLTVKLTTLERATVLGDRDRLRQLFLNLVTNAIKYTPRGGRVEISLSERLDGIAFSVRDSGIGISQTDLPHVFERFWRADHSRSRASGSVGFGLGLPIGHWIAQAHGGTLTAVSKMGRGSTFTVTLPHEGGTIAPNTQAPGNDADAHAASDSPA